MRKNEQDEDYLDRLSHVLPSHRPFTLDERILIVFFVAIFVSIVGCILFCLIYSRSPLRRRYSSKKKLDKERCILVAAQPRKNTSISSSPPSYESIVQVNDSIVCNKSIQNDQLKAGRTSSYGTASDSDCNGGHPSSIKRKIFYSPSTRSSLSNGTTHSSVITTNSYPSPPFAQVHIELNFDSTKNLLIIQLTNGEHISQHSAFDEHAQFFIHVQLLNNKILKKFHDIRKNHWSSLQLDTWKNQQEKTTKKLSRTSDDQLTCDEYLQFEFDKDNLKSTSLRFLLFCIDRSGIQDVMFESVIPLNSSIINKYQQNIVFKDLPQITFGEIYFGISYLPTAERLTIKLHKLRYLCKINKDEKIDARLIATLFHHGRRFSHKKFSPIIFDGSALITNNTYEITETITQNIPQNHIQSIYVHLELVIRILHSQDQSIISCGTILLGEHTRYESNWQQMLEQPRQTHLGWYPFFG